LNLLSDIFLLFDQSTLFFDIESLTITLPTGALPLYFPVHVQSTPSLVIKLLSSATDRRASFV
jgi:hypothetical protein